MTYWWNSQDFFFHANSGWIFQFFFTHGWLTNLWYFPVSVWLHLQKKKKKILWLTNKFVIFSLWQIINFMRFLWLIGKYCPSSCDWLTKFKMFFLRWIDKFWDFFPAIDQRISHLFFLWAIEKWFFFTWSINKFHIPPSSQSIIEFHYFFLQLIDKIYNYFLMTDWCILRGN